jgi:ParB family chromosome partitioning protein
MEQLQDIPVSEVLVSNRMRSEMGDIDNLAKSIAENGLINPITLTSSDNDSFMLVAGHRRFEALKKLGITQLEHGTHYLWRSELAADVYRRTAVELEENIRRKAMTWSEEVLGKQRLLQTYEKIYGAPKPGQPEKGVQLGLKPAGFGVRKLAELLNENASTTSQDLETAALIERFPILKNEPSREAAKRKLELAIRIHSGMSLTPTAKPLIYKILVECESEQHQIALLTQFRGAGLTCSPIVA